MNKARRKALKKLGEQLQDLRDNLEELTADEEEALCNTPENLQTCERYKLNQDIVTELDYAICCVEDAISSIKFAAE